MEPVAGLDAARVDELVLQCLDAMEAEGEDCVDRICRDSPSYASAVRERLRILQDGGLLSPDVAPAAPDEVPERLGPFELREKLGAGGMGVVYRAVEQPLDREVALKLIRPEQLYFPGSRERFQRELATVARLRHPHIVTVHRGGEEGGVPYYAMEYVEGCTLLDALHALDARRGNQRTGRDLRDAVRSLSRDPGDTPDEAGDWPIEASWPDVCCHVLSLVADALHHAHQRGTLHRDVKPSNIMITPSGRVKLVDFGLASTPGAARITRTGSLVGSLPYMAPEQLRASESIDARTDVYGLGITMYEMLTLRLPYREDDEARLRQSILGGSPELPRSLNRSTPWDVESICLVAMDREPDRRYQSAAALAEDLRHALARRPIQARRAGPWLRGRRWIQRHPTRAASLLFLLILVSSSIGFGWRLLGSNRELSRAVDARDQALIELHGTNEQLQGALLEARQSTDESHRHFERVIRAGIRMLTTVSEDVLGPGQVSHHVRDLLLAEAEKLAAELEREHPDDPALLLEMVRTYRFLGQFHADGARTEDARRHLQSARALAEDLQHTTPEDLRPTVQLLWTLLALAQLEVSEGEFERAIRISRDGIAAATAARALPALANQPEKDSELAMCTGMLQSTLGSVLALLDRHDEALDTLRSALDLLSSARSADPETLLRQRLAVRVNLATHLHQIAEDDEAEVLLAETLEMVQAVLDENPDHGVALMCAVAANLVMSELLRELAPEEAVDHARAGLELVARLSRRDPSDFRIRRNAVHGRISLAAALLELEEFEALEGLFEETEREARRLFVDVPAETAPTLARIAYWRCRWHAREGDLGALQRAAAQCLQHSDEWRANQNSDDPLQNHAEVHTWLAQLHREAGDLLEARAQVRQALGPAESYRDSPSGTYRPDGIWDRAVLLAARLAMELDDVDPAWQHLSEWAERGDRFSTELLREAWSITAGCVASSTTLPSRALPTIRRLLESWRIGDRERPDWFEGPGFDALREHAAVSSLLEESAQDEG